MTYDEALSAKLTAEDEYIADMRNAETDLGLAEEAFSLAEKVFHDATEAAERALASALDLYQARIEGAYP